MKVKQLIALLQAEDAEAVVVLACGEDGEPAVLEHVVADQADLYTFDGGASWSTRAAGRDELGNRALGHRRANAAVVVLADARAMDDEG